MSLKDIISRLPVSLGCGTWQAYDYAHADPKVFEKVLFTALDLGIQCFDSAESYGNGEAEKLLGRVIKGNRQQLLITSKFAHHHSRPDLIEKSLMKSLKRLGTDYLDVYFQHWPPQGGPRSETLETLIRLRKAGAVRFIGVSNWTPTDFEQCESLASQLDCVQVAYNYLWRHEL
ncbi:MAG: aldo/keto reductase, partial [Bdellovibrionales bacterium]|nr:aldo/keto reductase [Bdellovibrionales bacterium]